MERKYALVVTLLCVIGCLATARAAEAIEASVCRDGSGWRYVWKIDEGCTASGEFIDLLNSTGWDRLAVQSNKYYSDDLQAFAAGAVEGLLTAQQIFYWHTNFRAGEFGGKPPAKRLTAYFLEQIAWSRTLATQVWNVTSSMPQFEGNRTIGGRVMDALEAAFWRQVFLLYLQLDGIVWGYNKRMPDQPLSFFDIYLLNSAGDLQDLIGWYTDPGQPQVQQVRFEHGQQPWDPVIGTGISCSAFVKPVGSKQGYYEDLIFGHNTWSNFFSMNRIFKQYTLRFKDPFVKAYMVAFSSRPAFVCSKDDYYVTSAGIASQETTNSVADRSLYEKLTPESVLCFMRSAIANRLADNGDVWTKVFAIANSGTYNNQWMVVDVKKFTPGQPIQPGTLWILEQIPGYTQRADVSHVMAAKGYWPSYNVPYFAKIYNMSGYANGSMYDGQGALYLQAPRATLFAEYQTEVDSVEKLKWLLQHNNYKYDNVSQGDPAAAISARYDLRPQKAAAYGGLDTKIASYQMLTKGDIITHAISGPTHQGVPPFNWDDWPNILHLGQPTVWNFDWQAIPRRFNP